MARRARRTWPQRLLILCGLLLAAACFLAARVFWDARTVLADLPRLRVGPDVLAQPGSPGDPVNFLLVGVDSSEGLDPDDPVRSGRDIQAEAAGRFLSDTILMIRLDPATGDAAVLSIPRDLYVDVPGSSQWKINSTLLIGGMEKLIETIDANLSIPVNHFVIVDFAGFSELVDLIGGVPVYFPYPTRDRGSGLRIDEPGCWVLDGSRALGYVRARTLEEQIDGVWTPLVTPAPDLARIERQQEFMVLALEEALRLGGSDLGRIREFVQVGTQAVQLDELLTPGELLDLAAAFSEYDTEALRVATLPVQPLFADDGRYLGEELRFADATDLLAVFQGAADTVRPEDVVLAIGSDDGDSQGRAASQLAERGFVVQELTATSSAVPRTRILFGTERLAEALLVARYLEVAPAFETVDAGTLTLEIGPDFAGIRSFPRPAVDIQAAANAAAVTATTTATSAPTTTFSSTSAPSRADDAEDNSSTTAPPSTIERGRPPENTSCAPLPAA